MTFTTDFPVSEGLLQRIHNAGHWIVRDSRRGVFVSDDDPNVQSIIDNYTLEERRGDVKRRIDALARELRDRATANISPAEMASWAIRQSEAKAHRAGKDEDVALLAKEAQIRGVTVADIASRVKARAADLVDLEASISGTAGKHKDAVDALTDPWEIHRYDFSGGWPDVD